MLVTILENNKGERALFLENGIITKFSTDIDEWFKKDKLREHFDYSIKYMSDYLNSYLKQHNSKDVKQVAKIECDESQLNVKTLCRLYPEFFV